ncbi:hypothetical protein CB1_000030001 [Camelus ferus]|nr:hypothetical protein CB1_000030001 [Camelus ferus]
MLQATVPSNMMHLPHLFRVTMNLLAPTEAGPEAPLAPQPASPPPPASVVAQAASAAVGAHSEAEQRGQSTQCSISSLKTGDRASSSPRAPLLLIRDQAEGDKKSFWKCKDLCSKADSWSRGLLIEASASSAGKWREDDPVGPASQSGDEEKGRRVWGFLFCFSSSPTLVGQSRKSAI